MVDFDKFAGRLLEIEGGYQNDPTDSGNYTGCKVGIGAMSGTNNGISTCFYNDKVKSNPTVQDIKSITKESAKEIYRKSFWNYYRIDEFNSQDVAENVMDMIVNSGQMTGIKILQRSLNELGEDLKVDGGMGAITLSTVNRQIRKDEVKLFNTYTRKRREYYNSLSNKPAHQIKSWNNRLDMHFPFKESTGVGYFQNIANTINTYSAGKYPPDSVLAPDENITVEKEETELVGKVEDTVLYNFDVFKHSGKAVFKIGRIDPVVFSKDALRFIAIILSLAIIGLSIFSGIKKISINE